MNYNRKYYFFRCTHCGEWFYSSRFIKTKKCWKCNHAFQIRNSIKFSKNCTIKDAIAIIKELKIKIEEKSLKTSLKQYK